MNNKEKIREPIQKRSIEKKEKIIKIGFDVICKKGYYNTNTAEIAKAAGVSTGIVYNYFKDKKDIFIEGVKEYSNSIMFPILDYLDNIDLHYDFENNMKELVEGTIDIFIKKHKLSKSAHEELIAMSHLDKDVEEIFIKREITMTEKIVKILEKNNFNINNANEKVHIIIGLVENLCHELVYHNHKILDKEIMKKEVTNIVINCLKNNY